MQQKRLNMKQNKLVSIIIRTKNEENWIGLCLEKIFKQTYKNFEVIIVDNCSTDKTIQKAKEFKVKIIKIKKFLPGKAINLGVKKSKGEIIICLSAHCIPIKNSWLIELIKDLKRKDIAGIYGRQEPYSFSSIFDKRDLLTVFGLDKKIQKKDSFFHNANSCFLKKTWKKFNFDENATNIEDRIWGEQIIRNGYKIIYNPKASVYHYHGINQNLDKKRCEQIVKILESSNFSFVSKKNENSLKKNKLKILGLIPQKNKTLQIDNKYLIGFTINQLKKSCLINEVVVSTNDLNTKKISLKYGAKVPFTRPSSLSDDFIDLNSVLKFSLEEIEKRGKIYDLVVVASENYPYRSEKIFDKLIRKLINNNYDTVIASKVEKGSLWKRNRKENNYDCIYDNQTPRKVRENQLVATNTGYACVTRPSKIREGNLLNGKTFFYEIQDPFSFVEVNDIDQYKKFLGYSI